MAPSINPNSLGERDPLPTSNLEAFSFSSRIQNYWLCHCVPLIANKQNVTATHAMAKANTLTFECNIFPF